ncbi:MAG: hypothetical protein H7330_03725 [Hymenobacteraceae bacterium]|nr:hypothetical protein [Hymenobacteraceae bacterium]
MISHFLRLPASGRLFVVAALALMLAGTGCHRTVPFDTHQAAEELAAEDGKAPAKPPVPDSTGSVRAALRDTLVTASDTVNAPSLQTAQMKADADKLAKDKQQSKTELKALARKAGSAAKKLKGKRFLGKRIKKGYARSGSGKKAIIEKFYYLPRYEAPDPYAPAKFYYHKKRRKIFKTAVIDPNVALILHGPYEKRQGTTILESGYFYLGTKHLRWERYAAKDNILLSKYHWEKGFLRDARITYYENSRSKIREVLPYYQGQLEGDYVRFLANGQLDWTGQFQAGQPVGVWTSYWGFKNRRHAQWQYPVSAFVAQTEQELLREYNRSGTLIYEKGKLDKREADAKQQQRMTPNRKAVKGKAASKTAPADDDDPSADEDGESTDKTPTIDTPKGKAVATKKAPAAKTKAPAPVTPAPTDSTAAAPDPNAPKRPPTKEEARERARRGMSKARK